MEGLQKVTRRSHRKDQLPNTIAQNDCGSCGHSNQIPIRDWPGTCMDTKLVTESGCVFPPDLAKMCPASSMQVRLQIVGWLWEAVTLLALKTGVPDTVFCGSEGIVGVIERVEVQVLRSTFKQHYYSWITCSSCV